MGGFDQAIPSIISVNELSERRPKKKSPAKVLKTEASPGKKSPKKRLLIDETTPNKPTKPTEETEEEHVASEGKEMATQITEQSFSVSQNNSRID